MGFNSGFKGLSNSYGFHLSWFLWDSFDFMGFKTLSQCPEKLCMRCLMPVFFLSHKICVWQCVRISLLSYASRKHL